MTVLAAVDFSDASTNALCYAAREASARGESLSVVHCIDDRAEQGTWDRLFEPDDRADRLVREAESELRDLLERELDGATSPDEVRHAVETARPVEGVMQALDRGDIDLVVVGATGAGETEWFDFGSSSEAIVGESSEPVLVVPEDAEVGPWNHILTPIDFSSHSRRAMRMARRLADRDDGDIAVLHEAILTSSELGRPALAPSNEALESYRETVRRRLDAELQETGFDPDGVETLLQVHAYRSINPAGAIVERAEERPTDLIVMGTHGRRGLERVLMGSTAAKVLRKMPCPVLTIRQSTAGDGV